MYWTLELASYLSDAPWPATKDELIQISAVKIEKGEKIDSFNEYITPSQPLSDFIK